LYTVVLYNAKFLQIELQSFYKFLYSKRVYIIDLNFDCELSLRHYRIESRISAVIRLLYGLVHSGHIKRYYARRLCSSSAASGISS